MPTEFVNDWPDLPCNETIHLWILAGATHPECDQHLHRLAGPERERAEKFYFARDRRRFTGARLFLRQVLAHYLSCHTSEIAFEFNEWGKPALAYGPGAAPSLHFSLSRSHDVALLGVSTAEELGADIEKCLPERAHSALVHRQFCAAEQEYLDRASDRTAAFYDIWTGKEAYIKGLGFGLSHPLRTFSVARNEGAPDVVVQDWSDKSPATDWHVRWISLPIEGYTAAVASPIRPKAIEVIEVAMREVLSR